MKITPKTEEHDEIVRQGTLDDAPQVTITRYADKGKQLQPIRYRAVFHNRGGEWVCWNIKLVGFVIKQDGTVGKATNFRDYVAPLIEGDAETPAWIEDIVMYVAPAQEPPHVVVEPATFQS